MLKRGADMMRAERMHWACGLVCTFSKRDESGTARDVRRAEQMQCYVSSRQHTTSSPCNNSQSLGHISATSPSLWTVSSAPPAGCGASSRCVMRPLRHLDRSHARRVNRTSRAPSTCSKPHQARAVLSHRQVVTGSLPLFLHCLRSLFLLADHTPRRFMAWARP